VKIRTLIATGDSSLEILKEMLQMHCPGLEIIAGCSAVDQTVDSLRTLKPEFLFLDTDLPGGGGFELLRQVNPEQFPVIMISDVPDHAVEAYRYQVTDYLLKPIKTEELKGAVSKALKGLGSLNFTTEPEPESNPRNARKMTGKQLVIPNSKGFVVIKTDEIILCEASGYCTNFYVAGNSKISSSRNLKFYESLLPGGQFIRVHNSFIINRDHVKGYTYQGEIQLSENLKCSLSAGHKREFLYFFGKSPKG